MKRSTKYISLILAVILISAGCRHHSRLDDALSDADAMIYSAPDSALAVLDSLDTTRATESQRARHALLLTKARYKNYQNETDDSLISIAADFYAGRHDSLEMQSLFFKGFIRKNNRDYHSALILLLEAGELAKENQDHYFSGLCFRTQADIYSHIIAYSPQLEASLKAIDAFEDAGATEFAIWEHTTAAKALVYIDPSKALEHLATVRNSDYFNTDPAIQREYYDTMLLALQAKGEYMASADSIATADAKGLVTSAPSIINMALAYANVAKIKVARNCLKRIKTDADPENRECTRFHLEAFLDASEGDFESAYENMRLYTIYSDLYTDSLLIYPYTTAINNYLNDKAEAERQASKDFRIKSILAIGILFLAILLVIARLVITRKNYQLKNAQIDILLARMDAIDSENDRLKNEIKSTSDSTSDTIHRLRKELDHNISKRIETIDKLCYLWMTTPSGNARTAKDIKQRIDKLIDGDLMTVLEKMISDKLDNLPARIKAETAITMSPDQYNLLIALLAGLSRESMMAVFGKERNTVAVAIHRLKKSIATWPEQLAAETLSAISH